ncbi:hypothetical protein JOD29_000828 [Lysinibacillus composti]|uniref:Phage tail fibre protein N-terminal domain-containing protein n=1 Tax=Lysinibacillus composti TaxID=720633 RepID=A0A3N9UIV0_9BACI|nr:phage tail protein [Lysinibacillus composti]MBM7607584.1 hypothetical protein [Lysinibacillus composti]RQW75911.1 hypothetical protein EBB45_04655 [Lysinibacillus composti]
MAEFYTILTSIGLTKLVNAQLTADKLNITQIAVGDSLGSYYEPTQNLTKLKNEKWRGNVTNVSQDQTNPNWIVAEVAIPSTVGGWMIREVGLFDEVGDLIAVGKYPETYKPIAANGSVKDLIIRMIVEVNNASSVELKVDPTIITASRKYVDDKVAVSSQQIEILKSLRINVLDFNAKTDGSDNLTAFQSLSDYVNNLPVLVSSVEIEFPRGEFTYSGGLVFKRPTKLVGVLGTVLNYTGTAKAVEFGKPDLTISTYDNGIYAIQDIAFTGGLTMTHGIYFNNFLTMTRLNNVRLVNFGNPNAFGIWYNGNNWDSVMFACEWYSDISTKQNWVRVYNNGINSTRLRVLYCLGTNQSTDRGFGIWLDGACSEVAHSKIEGFAPNIRVGALSPQTRILDTYFETTNNGGCIQYGGSVDESGAGNYVVGLQIVGCYANMHNTDFIATTSHFLEPTTDQTGLQYAKVERNHIVGADREIVKQNSLGSQIGNEASGNTGDFTAININGSGWSGNQGSAPTFENKKDGSLYLNLKSGLTASQYIGLTAKNYDNSQLFKVESSSVINRVDHYVKDDRIMALRRDEGIESVKGLFRIAKQNTASVVATGTIFEDTDGKLKYKNLAGTVVDLTL